MKFYVDVAIRNRYANTEIVRTYLFKSRKDMKAKLDSLHREMLHEQVVLKDVSECLLDYGHARIVFGDLRKRSEL